ncbi:hypothetical protein BDP81DRAFT_415006 [Colletotrichum phormii]|uniref:Uncharacterized protein n=1 Tax=Colletotrichum phormii TaxID=359342 RepID=A0AAJ0A3U4_9PEZI|nr:uncharacterized protein BDP81DRAFT_415006 [Colletotrichum phormii]KAK1654115.1 hypothetical protein BDP81DRAFT_415006 [Colletotrichum phormii]
MDSSHSVSNSEALQRKAASLVAEVAKSQPVGIVGESGWSLVHREYGVWAEIETNDAGSSRNRVTVTAVGDEFRVDYVVDFERRDADESNGQQDEDVIMTDAPPIESDEGGIVDFNRYSEETVSINRRIEQLRIAPHQPCFHENAQVGETSEDVKMANSDW